MKNPGGAKGTGAAGSAGSGVGSGRCMVGSGARARARSLLLWHGWRWGRSIDHGCAHPPARCGCVGLWRVPAGGRHVGSWRIRACLAACEPLGLSRATARHATRARRRAAGRGAFHLARRARAAGRRAGRLAASLPPLPCTMYMYYTFCTHQSAGRQRYMPSFSRVL